MTDSTVERFRHLFRGRENAHGVYHHTPAKRVITERAPAPAELWRSHLAGEGPYLGIVPITLDNTCYFGAIDWDDNEADHAALEQRVRDLALPLIVCRSKSGGAHLYAFFIEPVPARAVQGSLRRWVTALGIENPPDENGQRPPVEVFPKQTKLRSGGVGNWINLPYYGGDATQRWALHEGERLDLDAFIRLAENRSLSERQLEATEPELAPSHPDFFADGPPCLQTLHGKGGFSAGTRNNSLYNICVFLKLKWPDDWAERARACNQEMLDPPLSDGEVDQVVRSVEGRDYVFKCNDLPISPVCQRTACKRRAFGIDRFRQRDVQRRMPTIGRLYKFLTEPPYWVLDVEDVPVKLTTEELYNPRRVAVAILERVNVVMPMLKATDWVDILSGLMENLTEVAVPEDAGVVGQFRHRLHEFLHLRHRSESRESLSMGKPWQENGKIYFRSSDLLDYLDRRRFRELRDPRDVWSVLRSMNAGHTVFEIKGGRVSCWWLPADAIEHAEQTEEFTIPRDEEPEF